jgi:anti-anti-sigma factor
MLSLRIEQLGDVTIIHCAGRIVFPDARELRIVRSSQLRTRILVLDLVDIVAIDAAGQGMLVSLRTWAKQTGRTLKLMNLTPWVERLLQLTKLKSEFEICSAREMLDLLCRAVQQSELVHSERAIENSESRSKAHFTLAG